MAKYNIEIDENDENGYPMWDINFFVNRHKIASALNEITDFRRSIYKGYTNEKTIIVKDEKVVIDEEGNKLEDYEIEGAKEYMYTSDIIDRLDTILEDVREYMD